MHSLPILLRVAVAAVALLIAIHVAAHPMPASGIFLDLEPDGVRAEMHLPLDRLAIAAGPQLQLDTATTTQTLNRVKIEAYLSERFSILDLDGARWNARFETVEVVAEHGASELKVRLWLWPRKPATSGEEPRRSVRKFRLRSDLIVHQLVTHKIVVFIRRDALRPGSSQPERVGRISYRVHELTIAR